MKQSQFYYLLRRGLLKSMSVVKEGLVMFNKFTTAGISHPAQGSAEFDGSSDYIQLDNAFSYTNHTVAAWVYNENATGIRMILDARDASNDGILLYTSGTTLYYNVNSNTVAQSSAIPANEWFCIVGTYDGTTQRLYIDGSQVGSSTPSQTISTTTGARIGARSHTSPAYYWDGNFANVAIWNRALSSDEVNSVMWKGYQSLTDNEKSGLQAWYSLDDVASPAASLATMEQLATDKEATIENKAAITAAINALS
jgi:hypothetical protein